MSEIRAAQRIWLADHGVPFFGAGVRELLLRVEADGSLHQAAVDMGMAYSKAWHIVHRAEEHLGFPLLERHSGGNGGGGSTLSEDGRWIVAGFGALRTEASELLDELYHRHLGERLGGSGSDGVLSIEHRGAERRPRAPSNRRVEGQT